MRAADGRAQYGSFGMNPNEMMRTIDRIIEIARTAVLATVDGEGRPHMRWMTPAVLKGRPGAIYAVTSPRFAKSAHLDGHPNVAWMFQTPALDEVVTVTGHIEKIDNPALKTELMDALGKRLRVFWKVSQEQTDFIVLETIIERAEHFRPMIGQKEAVVFEPEAGA